MSGNSLGGLEECRRTRPILRTFSTLDIWRMDEVISYHIEGNNIFEGDLIHSSQPLLGYPKLDITYVSGLVLLD